MMFHKVSLAHIALSIGFAVLAVMPVAYAQQAPNGGSLLQQLQQEKQLKNPGVQFENKTEEPAQDSQDAGGLKVLIKTVRFEGNVNVTIEELQAVFANYVDKEYTFSGLEKLAGLVGEIYRKKGLWAKGVLPEQTLAEGELLIRVVEGKLGSLRIEHQEERLRISEERAKAYAMDGQEGDVFSIDSFTQAIKALDDVPGVTAAAVLAPGQTEGETDVIVKMANTPMFTGSVRADNHGSRATSWNYLRLGGFLNVDSPFGFGEQFNFIGIFSRGSLVASAGASVPIGVRGIRAGLNYTALTYELGYPLEDLGAAGESQVASGYLSIPFVRKDNLAVLGQLNVNHGDYLDEINENDVTADKTLDVATASLTTYWPDRLLGGGVSSITPIYTFGDLDRSAAPEDLALDAASANTQGQFHKLSLQANREQVVHEKSQLWFSFLGQVASKNLDSSQKISLGGASAVRAYPGGEGSGDQGAIVTLEYRYSLSDKLQGIAFYDQGWVRQTHTTWDGWNDGSSAPNAYSISGYGLGIKWRPLPSVEVVGYVADRIGNNPAADPDGNDNDGTKFSPRGWLSIVTQF
jgi:hemolysin activation/secretion protein